ncbi:hypothetical protein [Oceanobacillus saliphilus]|uniref:hypothetical protein n=1 Tax=Oceanobacillus saliphilus TaxID=2925834 RepID=UPI00201E2E3B|nr:hypothetical protein [Oceanobacillus saliphilus]
MNGKKIVWTVAVLSFLLIVFVITWQFAKDRDEPEEKGEEEEIVAVETDLFVIQHML